MIIRGKEFSEDTIAEALQKHCNFEEEKYVFQCGDVVKDVYKQYRIILHVDRPTSELVSCDLLGKKLSSGQADFESYGYKKVGTLQDFIN